MDPGEYVAFAADRIAEAVASAWRNRAPGTIGFGLGQAVVGRNRRSVYADGSSQMYGNTATAGFSHIEGYEDHGVNLLGTWDAAGTLTGLVVNVACPSQVSENLFELSADYWHETRVELRKRYGEGLFVLPQCSAAGDQAPHIQWGKAAEERMLRLSGRTMRQEIAMRIADTVSAVLPAMERERVSDPVLVHRTATVDLPRRRLSESDVAEAMAEHDTLKAEYEAERQALDADPSRRNEPRWYVRLTHCYRRMKWCEGVALRFELEKTSPTLPVEAHVIRLGDMAIASNPFELYLDYAIRIRELSKATQTFLVQKAGSNGTYLPSQRSLAGKGYGSVPASTDIGPEGGERLVEWTVSAINRMWAS